MRKKARIIEITGFSGILKAIFVVTCLIAGFVVFPGYVAMALWNKFASMVLPEINLFQGVLLWSIVFLLYFISSKNRVEICFGTPKELSEEEMSILMERVRHQSRARINNIVMKNIEELKQEALKKDEDTDTVKK